ncbi:tyrosine-type recombinase/integrase [Tenacibaculum piscium]|uniref:tyrosine-type recombinase/integrase n=1 Tax=Tenacibaculum piscium TaxID=1458515 RepID=UPI00187BADF1|nr:phage integrase SAM-like domain-containing protein [Tenacibaculum piscium]MBE7686233.1 tyrosine-type recombinase/integrase [Tenacibaculum piscium]
MATVNFYYRSTKDKANLTVRFYHRNKIADETKNLPYSDISLTSIIESKEVLKLDYITKNFWKQKDKRNAPVEVDGINILDVKRKLKELEVYLLDSYKRDKEILLLNKEWLLNQIDNFSNPNQLSKESFYLKYWIDFIIDTAPKRANAKNSIGLSYNTIKGYKDLKNVIRRYQTLETTKVINLNTDWFTNFFDWLIYKQNYSHNTAVKKVAILKAVINEASKKIPVPENLNTLKFKVVSTYDTDTDVITLSENDINKIEAVKLNSLALINARKYLIIACYTGQRGTALIELIKKENFVKVGATYRIEIKQIKGSKKVLIPVLPKVLEIYKTGLPYKVSTQKLNKYFKEICKLAEINELILGKKRNELTNRNEKKERPKYQYISTHVGRRTFATLHYNKLPVSVIMKVTGHTKVATFMKYIQKDTDEHIEVFNDYYKMMEDNKANKPANLKVVREVTN